MFGSRETFRTEPISSIASVRGVHTFVLMFFLSIYYFMITRGTHSSLKLILLPFRQIYLFEKVNINQKVYTNHSRMKVINMQVIDKY